MNDRTSLIKDLLETKPLYYKIILSGQRYKLLEIDSYCEICKANKPFHNTTATQSVMEIDLLADNKLYNVSFSCVTCKTSTVNFYLKAQNTPDNKVSLEKIGQYPQVSLPRSNVLSRFFSKDKQDYHKAIVCLGHGYGVGAFAYMRRIIENNIHEILDLIAECASSDTSLAVQIAELKNTSPMSDKIEIANRVLPDSLKLEGFNPLGEMYKVLSEGIHSLPDDECLNKASHLQACLEFLIGEIYHQKKSKEAFKSHLINLRK